MNGKKLTLSGAGKTSTSIRPSTLAQSANTDPNHPGTPQSDIVAFDNTTGGGIKAMTIDGSAVKE
ncbi:MAG: hypothetical protein ACRDK8_12170, partial [Solirubrobacteraceae bacterium]